MSTVSPLVIPADTLARSDIDRLRMVLLRLARKIRNSSAGDITPSQRIVLASIIFHERLTISQIAELEHIKPPSNSKIVAAECSLQ
jgi:DNA-binding MarR family transcriptional regulator